MIAIDRIVRDAIACGCELHSLGGVRVLVLPASACDEVEGVDNDWIAERVARLRADADDKGDATRAQHRIAGRAKL
jgi:hypothetical protein